MQAAKPAPAPTSIQTAKPPPQQVAKATPGPTPREVAKATAVAPSAGGAYRVQIGALRSEEDAQKTIAHVKKVGGDVLAGFGFEVKRADLGDKGIYYRVQIGPLADAAAASGLCERLKDRKLGCMVVRP